MVCTLRSDSFQNYENFCFRWTPFDAYYNRNIEILRSQSFKCFFQIANDLVVRVIYTQCLNTIDLNARIMMDQRKIPICQLVFICRYTGYTDRTVTVQFAVRLLIVAIDIKVIAYIQVTGESFKKKYVLFECHIEFVKVLRAYNF